MKLSIRQKKAIASVSVGAAALALPMMSFAAGFGSGALLTTGTDTNFMTAVASYFYPAILATLFQAQVINIMVALAAVVLVIWAIRKVWRKFHSPHR